jgi:hypothetical protein
MKSSVLLSQAGELTRKAEEAKRLADEANRELNRLWNEYNQIPDRIHAAQSELDSINKLLADLDPAKLREEFKRHYRATMGGAMADPFAQANLAGVIVTADPRREVLKRKGERVRRTTGSTPQTQQRAVKTTEVKIHEHSRQTHSD